ncbi:MAG: bifunctional 5,10-methylenetetrahydrofolate dehydrogenase/5,10-methenyltetrahydrofolate cyclohydrolase [Phycisphaerae bacterium]
MCARIVDGNAIALNLKQQTAELTRQLRAEGCDVRLDAIMVGDPSTGAIYARSQQAQCHAVGIEYRLHTLPAGATERHIRQQIDTLNLDPQVTGIMLNLPLPKGIDTPAVQYAIDPYKDVEGINPSNIGMLFYDSPIIAPCTALAVMEILRHVGCNPRGMDAVVVGQSAIAGRPIGLFLQHELATVTTCHIDTRDLIYHTRNADLLVVAAGKPRLVGKDHVKPGAVVIDVGINRLPDDAAPSGYKTVGDVDLDEVKNIASVVTPVPGGVGPVTVAMLLRSAVDAARNQRGPRRITS